MIDSSCKKMLLCSAFSLPSRPPGGDLYPLFFLSYDQYGSAVESKSAPVSGCMHFRKQGRLARYHPAASLSLRHSSVYGKQKTPTSKMEIGATFRGTTLHCTYRSVRNVDQPFLLTCFRRNTPEGHIALPDAPAHTARRLSSVIHEMLWKISVIVFAVLIVLIIWRFFSSVNPFFEIFCLKICVSSGCRISASAHQYRRASLHHTSGA